MIKLTPALNAGAASFVPMFARTASSAPLLAHTPPRAVTNCKFGTSCSRPNCRYLHKGHSAQTDTNSPTAKARLGGKPSKPRSGVKPRRLDVNDLATGMNKIKLTDSANKSKKQMPWHWKTHSPPVADFSGPYTEPTLRPFEGKYYKAAGVMPLCWRQTGPDPTSKRLHTLLGVEPRGKHGMMLNILGGKREQSDQDSAVRM
jgi:hypothetical protein